MDPPASSSSASQDEAAAASSDESELASLRAKLTAAETRASEAESNMLRAAQLGKELLARSESDRAEAEAARQESHELQMRLNSKAAMEEAWMEEMDHLREMARAREDAERSAHAAEKDCVELRRAVEAARAREKDAEERAARAEEQLREALDSSALAVAAGDKSAVGGTSFSEELSQLQAEQVDWLREKSELNSQLCAAREEAGRAERQRAEAAERATEAEARLEDKEREAASFQRKMDELREELHESQAECEQMRTEGAAAAGNADKKGNSLFSEVEDRRHLVEKQLARLRARAEATEAKLEAKNAELRKVKMHNIALLNLTGAGGGAASSAASSSSLSSSERARLEELLAVERERNRALLEQIEGAGTTAAVQQDMSAGLENSRLALDATTTSPSAPHTSSSQYSYLTTMLDAERRKNAELQKQLQSQMRQSLEDSDRLADLSKRVSSVEAAAARTRAENYQLKMRLDDALSAKKKEGSDGKGAAAAKRKPRKQVVNFEELRFEDEKENEEEAERPPAPLILVERAVDDGNAEKVAAEEKKAKKKTVSISGFVDCRGGDEEDGGESKREKINDEGAESASVAVSSKAPTKKRRFNRVIDAKAEADKMEQECKQQ